MSRRNRNNNRYNSRNRNKWDEGYEDDYFDEDESSDQQDEYDQSEYEDEEEYDEDESEEEEYDQDEDEDESDEEYDEDESEDEEYDEDEYDEEEYDEQDESDEEDSDDEYDEDESDDEDVEEEESDESDEDEEEYEEDDEEDELESEINAAAESTAKKSLGNSDLLSKLRGQLRPQIKEDEEDSNSGKNNDLDLNVSPLSLFGQPIGKSGKKDEAPASSSAPPQHANAKIVQTTVVSKPSTPSMAGSMQKAASGRVITAQSLNGASVSSVQPRDLEAEKAEADRKQKEKELLEQAQKEKAEKSARILDKFKGKKTPAGESAVKTTKAGFAWLRSGVVWTWSKIASGCAWTWSKIVSGGAWVWAGIAACFLWLFWSKPGQAWQTWRIFNRSWWSGIGSGVWNAMKYPFVSKPAAVTEEGAPADGSTPNPAEASASQDSVPALVTGKKKFRKKTSDSPVAEPVASRDNAAPISPIVSKEPENRRRLYLSLSSIGTAAVVFLLFLPLLTNANRKTDENAIALNEQENDSQTSKTNGAGSDSNSGAASSTSPFMKNAASDSKFQNVRNADRVGSQVDKGNAENGSFGDNTSSTRPSGFAPDRVGSQLEVASDELRVAREGTKRPTGADFGNSAVAQTGSGASPSTRPRGSAHDRDSRIQNMSSAVPKENASRNSSAPSARNNSGSFDNKRVPGSFDNTRNPGSFNNNRVPGSYDNKRNPGGFDNNQPLTPPAYSNNAASAPRNSQHSLPGANATRLATPVPSVPELDMTVPEMPAPEVTILDAPELDTTAQELSTPEIPPIDSPELELPVPEAPAEEVPTEIPVPELSIDNATLPEETPTEIPVPELSIDDATVPETPTEIPVPDLSLDDASVPDVPTEIPAPETPADDASVPKYVPTENPVSEDVQTDQTDTAVPEIPDPEYVNAEDPADALSTPTDQNADTNYASDPFNVGAADVPEDSTVDLTPNADELSRPAVEPETIAQPEAPVDLPTPEIDEPDVPAPDPVDSTPIEVPSIPEPSVPEPAIEEPAPIETGIASQPTQPAASEPVLTPDNNATTNSQLAPTTPELPTTPQATGVELGTPGPLVSSAASSSALQTQKQEVAAVNPNVNVSTPSTTPDYGTSYNNGRVYNSSGVYIVQPNDSFWTIAKRVYGSGEYARALVEYNSSRVHPESLTVSTQIMTPPPETLERQYPELCPTRGSASGVSQPGTVAAQPNTRVYVVDQEESVMEIVRRELGSVLYCSQVYALNQEQLSGSVDRVKPGVRLLLPVKK